MNWTKFITYGESPQNAFETLCNQLFERFLKRTYHSDLIKFRVINGAGGDGGIEAYGKLTSGEIIAIQAKWFQQSISDSEIRQIKKSILTAKKIRAEIKEYIICIPHDVNSLKIGRGKKPTTNHEENKINNLVEEIHLTYPDLTITWWFDNEILTELQQQDNEGVHKFWFDKEVISMDYLSNHFAIQKRGWLNERYIPELHGQGLIHKEYEKLCFSSQYRKELFNKISQARIDIRFCISQIEHFIPTNSVDSINDELLVTKDYLKKFLEELKNIADAIKTGNDFYIPLIFPEVDLCEIKLKLEECDASNIQKNILPKLISSLQNIHEFDLPQYIQHFIFYFNQKIRLILGESGTGKTHGLTNCVESHLAKNSPSLIIQAKGSACNNWTEILCQSLEIDWNKDEILSAFETLAIKNDIQKATSLNVGEENDYEVTKAIICIDGLEEEIANEKEWYERLRECEELTTKYPRIRFLFSARRYFYNHREVPESEIFEEVFLPREGDIPIEEVAPYYFSADNYNIQLSSPSLIRGIDSLLALRLFCEEYRNQSINATNNISTATRDLINLKIKRLNSEFISKLQSKKGAIRNPIMDSLEIIAKFFYKNHEIEHNELVKLISEPLEKYLDVSEMDSLIDYLTNNAFLIRFDRINNEGILKKTKHYYSITYQSMIEHIISENIYYEIKSGSLDKIPEFLHKVMIRPLDFGEENSYRYMGIKPNEKIIQNIINNSLIESGKLIGDDSFLSEGFDEWKILEYQLVAISAAPINIAQNFKSKIDELLNGSYINLSYVLKYLIFPSSSSQDSVFGAEYLHEILMKFSVFERDKLWSGLDMYELTKVDEIERDNYQYEYENIFRQLGIGNPTLYEWDLHNGKPLIFAWGLSTIDQKLRSDLRISLTGWGIINPSEFVLLLTKIFNCNDPQIQEDLASIMLGIASRLKDKEKINELAQWSIANVFDHLKIHRNIIVRQGFRAIIERAFQHNLVSEVEIQKCRPSQMQTIDFLPLERNLETTSEGQSYPIVHDLKWYVIGKSYSKFLEYPSSFVDGLKDNDCSEAKILLDMYREKYNDDNLFADRWSMEVAISYIKRLGFTRLEGNNYTKATHGSKSEVFTYEEKYTWLAVHYIQGYLSDYIPAKSRSGNREFVSDYSQITDIPNPAEFFLDIDAEIEELELKRDWVVKEVLSSELETGIEINQSISNWVNEEPIFNLENWLTFDSTDFQIAEPNKKWIALYNGTSLSDSKEYCNSYFNATACIIKSEDLPPLLKIIQEIPEVLNFISNSDNFYSTPKTSTYSNPTDIVWMTWIEEDDTTQSYYDGISEDEKYLYHTVTQITRNTVEGEDYFKLPSKKIRKMIDCIELVGDELKNANGITTAFNFKKSDGAYRDSQELVLVDKDILETAIEKEGYEIIWFIDLFKKKNPLNENLDKDFHVQKSRKYFVWTENNEKKSINFWDEHFSNRRDEDNIK